MGMFSFYNNRRPRQFDHKPIYFDPHKEAMEERVRQIKKEMGLIEEDEDYKTSIKGSFVEGTSHLKKRRAKGETSSSRSGKSTLLIVAVVILVILGWYLFFK